MMPVILVYICLPVTCGLYLQTEYLQLVVSPLVLRLSSDLSEPHAAADWSTLSSGSPLLSETTSEKQAFVSVAQLCGRSARVVICFRSITPMNACFSSSAPTL